MKVKKELLSAVITIAVLSLIATALYFIGKPRWDARASAQPAYDTLYEDTLKSYIPSGYTVSKERVKQYTSLSDRRRRLARLYKYCFSYTDNNGKYSSSEACITVGPYDKQNYGSADKAMSQAIQIGLHEAFGRKIRTSVKYDDNKPLYTTPMFVYDSQLTTTEALTNAYSLNLENLSWEDFARIPANYYLDLRVSTSCTASDSELEAYCQNVCAEIKEVSDGDIDMSWKITKK